MANRREFVIQISVAGSALLAGQAMAQTPMVVETDAAAVGLGYKADSTKVDAKKYPKHAPAQMCSGCALFQGKASDAAGACALFPGKQVSGKGWCSAWVKKG